MPKFMGNIGEVLKCFPPKTVYADFKFNEKKLWNVRHMLWDYIGCNQFNFSR